MRFVIYSNCISPHQLPLAQEISRRVGPNNLRYVCIGRWNDKRAGGGWQPDLTGITVLPQEDAEAQEWLANADIMLVGGMKPIDLIEHRLQMGLKTYYQCERWLKPVRIDLRLFKVVIPGWLKLLVPSYRRSARRFASLFKYPAYRYLPIGIWARRDMELICRAMHQPFNKDQAIDWGYFVAPSSEHVSLNTQHSTINNPLRVLWVGRMLDWKRVDTLIRGVVAADEEVTKACVQRNVSLTLVGDGPEKKYLSDLVAKLAENGQSPVVFLPPVKIEEVRKLMRAHDVYVLASNAEEGWGAALNEALEEGMIALGTYEAGASGTVLPPDCQFRAGDWRQLSRLLVNVAGGAYRPMGIGEWSVRHAAERILA